MDRSVEPGDDFYRFGSGGWIRRNPVPADMSRWGAFDELIEYNLKRLHSLVRGRGRGRSAGLRSVAREVDRFFSSGMNVRLRDRLRFGPLSKDLAAVGAIRSLEDLGSLIADFHTKGIPVLFSNMVYPDKRQSRVYAFYVQQGGLSLPDREYYLERKFASVRKAFRRHLTRMFGLLGDGQREARREAAVVFAIEVALARASRTRTELRDAEKNYNKETLRELRARMPSMDWDRYLGLRGGRGIRSVIVGQPEFFNGAERLLRGHDIDDWRTYLRWHLLRASAPYLHHEVESEYFRFFHQTLLGQRRPEPRWKRTIRAADRAIGDSLGRLFIAAYFPRAAAVRMLRLVRDLQGVFRDRLRSLPWMSPITRRRALAKFKQFTVKIGHPRRFRDDSSLRIRPTDYWGNVQRALSYESRRRMAWVGHPVDPDEWRMTAPTVNAYFDSTQNEIVFPAGILQPPFFDPTVDDAVNYGAIGVVIGHEITHGYDDQGRRYDAQGNLRDWWTPRDAREFGRRSKRVVAQYDAFEALPGAHVNGALTVGENIADLGGVSIALEALRRRLARSPALRRSIDGLTPIQRFFISFAQIWRQNTREQDVRYRLTVDTHSPGRFRVIGPVQNSSAFFEAFDVGRSDPMFRPESLRVQIW